MVSNMTAELLIRRRQVLSEDEFVEIVIWRVDPPVPGSAHGFKYRFAFVSGGRCLLRYDNERGKGDHRHEGDLEEPVYFEDPDSLLDRFFDDVRRLRRPS